MGLVSFRAVRLIAPTTSPSFPSGQLPQLLQVQQLPEIPSFVACPRRRAGTARQCCTYVMTRRPLDGPVDPHCRAPRRKPPSPSLGLTLVCRVHLGHLGRQASIDEFSPLQQLPIPCGLFTGTPVSQPSWPMHCCGMHLGKYLRRVLCRIT